MNDDLGQFTAAGYVVLRRAFPASQVAALQHAAERALQYSLQVSLARAKLTPRLLAWRLPDGAAYVFKMKPVLDLSPELFAAAQDRKLLAPLTRLMSGSEPLLMEEKLNFKQIIPEGLGNLLSDGGGPIVHRHTDASYFRRYGFPLQVISSALCLDDCGSDSGPLQVWPGTHLQSVREVETEDAGTVVPDGALRDTDAVSLVVEAGSLLLWDSRLVHASSENRSTRPRRLLVLGHVSRSLHDGRNARLEELRARTLEFEAGRAAAP
jgi:ectoine hydroxylase-related dioxygenase (phytanoyl-CoA dioxygenase family)